MFIHNRLNLYIGGEHMARLADIVVSLTLENSEFVRGIERASKDIESLGKDIERSTSALSSDFSRTFKGMSDNLSNATKEFNRFGSIAVKTSKLTGNNLDKLPTHVKSFHRQLRLLQTSLVETRNEASAMTEDIKRAVTKTQVSIGKLTSLSDEGREVIKTLNKLTDASREVQLAIMGFDAEGKNLISADDATKSFKRFEKQLDDVIEKLEEARENGDYGSYFEGLRYVENELKKVEGAMQATAMGGEQLLATLTRLGVVTKSTGNAAAVAMERMKESARLANLQMQNMDTTAQKLMKSTKQFDGYYFSQQFLKIGDSMERAARAASPLNLAFKQLGKDAPFKDILDRVNLINTGIMRMTMLQMGMGLAVLATTYGLIQLSNEIDGRLIPAFKELKQTWSGALEPFVRAFTTAVLGVMEFANGVGELMKRFAELYPQLSQMFWGFLYLTMVMTLLLAPLAIGIGLTDGLAVAFRTLFMMIRPFVLGFLTVIGTAMTLAAVIVVLIASINNMWKYSDGFRSAVIGLWEGIKTAWLRAIEPIKAAWGQLKVSFTNLIKTLSGGEATSISSFWAWLGDVVGNVITYLAKVLIPILSVAFTIIGKTIALVFSVVSVAITEVTKALSSNSGTINSVIGAVIGFFKYMAVEIGAFIVSVLPTLKETFNAAFEAMKAAIQVIMPILTALMKFLAGVFIVMFPIIKVIVLSVFDAIKGAITSGLGAIQAALKLLTSLLRGDFSNAWESVKLLVKNVVAFIWNIANVFLGVKLLKLLGTLSATIIKGIAGAFSRAYLSVKTSIGKMYEGIVTTFGKFIALTAKYISPLIIAVTTAFTNLKDRVKEKVSSAYDAVSSKFGKMKEAMTKPISSAYTFILNQIGKIKSAFNGMKLSIPKPKLPTIRVGSKSFLDGKVKIPTFSISWNAKGNIFNGASLLGGGQGVGEAGAEVVMPIEHKRYMKPYASLVASMLPKYQKDGAQEVSYNINFNQPVIIREEADIKRIVEAIEKERRLKERASGVFSYA